MIKPLIERYIRRTKNSNFEFDSRIRTPTLLHLLADKFIGRLRAIVKVYGQSYRHKIFLGPNVRIRGGRMLEIGNNVVIGSNVYLDASLGDGIEIGDNCKIGDFGRLIVSQNYGKLGKRIVLQANVGLGEFAYIGGAGNVSIGEGCIIGQYFSVHPENHIFDRHDIPIRFQGVTNEGVAIGDNCWIGAKVTVLDGVSIGSGCVIAAGAVVTKSFDDGAVIGGVPARIISIRS